MDDTTPQRVGKFAILLTGCRRKEMKVLFTGSWAIDDASSRLFEWKAAARFGGVIPFEGVVVAPLGCSERGPGSYPYPGGELMLRPDGFADLALAPGDVFIPLDGDASLDHSPRATATLEAKTADAIAPTVAVSVASDGGHTMQRGLRARDLFVWGDRQAAIVRIVEPQGGEFGAIGWVEVRVAGGS